LTQAIYADAALTLGDYLLKRYYSQLDPDIFLVEISDLIIEKALISGTDDDWRRLRAAATVALSERTAYIEFSSVRPPLYYVPKDKEITRYRYPQGDIPLSDIVTAIFGLHRKPRLSIKCEQKPYKGVRAFNHCMIPSTPVTPTDSTCE
jgi:hypothetical protein